MKRNILTVTLIALLGATGHPALGETFRYPAAARIVAVGDLHGDLPSTREALRLAGAIDEQDRWIGGDLVLVQTGDQLDRGDQEQAILDLLERLSVEAAAAGGAVHILHGNHELMNARPDLRYVTEGGFADFAEFAADAVEDSLLLAHPPLQRGRVAAFRPGGPYARVLARHHLYVVIGETVFVHGGLTPRHLEIGLQELDDQVRDWLTGEGECPAIIHTGDSPTWERLYSDEVGAAACDTLALVLGELGVERMVVGHTVQEPGITAYCDGHVWCIDTGLADYYAGPTQVLEITGDEIRILRLP